VKSLVCITPGSFAYTTGATPVAGAGETLLRIQRIGICGTDLHAFEGTQPYFQYPRILGHELAAEIVTTAAEGFTPGEAVTIIPYFNCGTCVACRKGKPNCCSQINVCGVHVDGGMREYLVVPDYSLVKSEGLSWDELALVEPLAIGAHAIRRAGVEKNDVVLVIGAGPIGLGTMEFARIAGATVIAMDINPQRLAFCKEKLNVAHVVNAADTAVIEQIKTITRGDMADVVIDCTGNLRAINGMINYLAHGGRAVLVGLQKEAFAFNHPEFHKRESTLMSSRNATRADFDHVVQSMKNGLVNPATYITHRLDFDKVKDNFKDLLDPANGVIKAMITI
jgi:2-desacetyl-2-hydroxyethyl bacteriochlorophyllide A dehydrogenase